MTMEWFFVWLMAFTSGAMFGTLFTDRWPWAFAAWCVSFVLLHLSKSFSQKI